MKHAELLDYYYTYCEQAIWFQKIMHSDSKKTVTVKEVAAMLIAERNRVAAYFPHEQQTGLKKEFNKIAAGYYSRISHWSKLQKITTDMV